ncbi:MAG: hypothetical protein ABIR70_17785 [Bryobacteraceae bacterium]
MGITARGAVVNVTGNTTFRVSGGAVIEGWQNWEMLGMLEQAEGLGKDRGPYIAGS